VADLTVVYDACVLYPAPLRDFLMWLALTDLFKARWTSRIHDEWISNVLQNRPDLTVEQLTKTRNLMDRNVRDCLVTGFARLIEGLELPDPSDRHVLAAAIRCHADLIITFNLKDFPSQYLQPYGVEAQHPDEFILRLIDLHPTAVCAAANKHRSALKNPPKSREQYLDTLLKQGLSKSSAELHEVCYGI